MDPHVQQLPTTLLDCLCNPIIADNLLPYLPLASICRLSRTAHLYREWVLQTPKVFRYLDLSRAKGAFTPFIAPIDNGGHSWRAERMDENLTEEEFYSGPLRSVLNRLTRLNVIQDVQVLVLDRLASVTNDLIYDLVTDDRYNVRLLSVRQCPNINQSGLQQLLKYVCRPSRPEGTPRLQGFYFFTDPSKDCVSDLDTVSFNGVTTTDGASLGLLPSDKALLVDNAHQWYTPAGRVTSVGADSRSFWEDTLQVCDGIIAFDIVLCKAMHQHMASCLHEASQDALASKPGVPAIATISLGSLGCSGCGKAPLGTPVWGTDNVMVFPLLSPPPYSGKLMDAIRPPSDIQQQRLIVSCKWCMVNRHCDSCHKWWCTDCYRPKSSNKLRDLEALSNAGLDYLPTAEELQTSSQSDGSKGDSIKEHDRHHHYLPVPSGRSAVTRECWDCGRVCAPCASRSGRICKRCKNSYCVWHNTGCDEDNCDWCQFRGGNTRLRELY